MNFPDRLVALILALCFALAGPSDVIAEGSVLQLTYSAVTTTVDWDADAQKTVTDTIDSEVDVWLAENRFAIRIGSSTFIYDLRAERLIVADSDLLERIEFPLFTDVAFRVLEMQNRIWIHRGLQNVGLSKRDPSEIRGLHDLETLFGLPWPHAVDDLPGGELAVLQPKPGYWQFQIDGEPESKAVSSQTQRPLLPEHRDAYLKWLLYSMRMHPSLWDALSQGVASPLQEIQLNSRDGFQQQRKTYRLERFNESATWPVEIKTIPRVFRLQFPNPAPHNDFAVWAERIAAAPDGDGLPPRPTEAEAQAAAEAALEAGHPLDAFLALIGFGLQEGVRFDDQIRRLVAEHGNDPQFASYLAIARRDDEQADDPAGPNAYERMLAIDRTGLKHAHVLDIFTANEALAVGEVEAACRHFAAALEVNPHITGVWHDLAGLARESYDTFTAWACFDIARQLRRDHPMLQRLDSFEDRLRDDFPRFFMTTRDQ
ncbi:MAG: hypothetical protein AAGF84_12080 [Planctomycetota bacterium]